MHLLSKAVSALALAGASFAAAAAPVTLTFEGAVNTIYTNPILRSGFLLGNPDGQEQHFHEVDSQALGPVGNGTGVLANDRDTQIFVKRSDGGVFSGLSVDVGSTGSVNFGSNIGMDIEAFLGLTSVGLLHVDFDTITPLQRVSLLGLGNFDRLVFDGIRGGFALDNLSLEDARNAVPLPSSLALACLGLGVLGRFGRRRQG